MSRRTFHRIAIVQRASRFRSEKVYEVFWKKDSDIWVFIGFTETAHTCTSSSECVRCWCVIKGLTGGVVVSALLGGVKFRLYYNKLAKRIVAE